MTNTLKHAVQWNLYDNTELILLKNAYISAFDGHSL